MLAVDTNILVRLVAQDDAPQAARATALLRSTNVWIAKTVLLETHWVLRNVYRFSREEAVEALRELAGVGTVVIEDEAVVAKAFEWSDNGMDFADSLHLASAAASEGFATFDRALARTAKPLSPIDVIVL